MQQFGRSLLFNLMLKESKKGQNLSVAVEGRNRDCGLCFQGDDDIAAFTMWVKREVVRAILSATKQERSDERHEKV